MVVSALLSVRVCEPSAIGIGTGVAIQIIGGRNSYVIRHVETVLGFTGGDCFRRLSVGIYDTALFSLGSYRLVDAYGAKIEQSRSFNLAAFATKGQYRAHKSQMFTSAGIDALARPDFNNTPILGRFVHGTHLKNIREKCNAAWRGMKGGFEQLGQLVTIRHRTPGMRSGQSVNRM